MITESFHTVWANAGMIHFNKIGSCLLKPNYQRLKIRSEALVVIDGL